MALPSGTIEHMRSKRKYAPRPRVLVSRTCEECGVEFTYMQGHKAGQPCIQMFCGNDCRLAVLQRVPRPAKGKGAGYTNDRGYRYLNVVDDAGKVRVVSEHRWIMQQHLGRELTSTEVVHHVNHQRDDNRIENLELVDSHAAHIREHHPSTYTGRRILGEKWSRNYDRCVICERSDSKHRGKGVCGRCMEARRREAQVPGTCSVCQSRPVRYGGSGKCRSCAMKESRAGTD